MALVLSAFHMELVFGIHMWLLSYSIVTQIDNSRSEKITPLEIRKQDLNHKD